MNVEQLSRVFAEMTARWPDFEVGSLNPRQFSAYADDMARVSVEDGIAGVRNWSRKAKAKPPTPGQLYSECVAVTPSLAEPEKYSGPRCTCHIAPGFSACKAKHPDKWRANREREEQAAQIVAGANAAGVPVDASANPELTEDLAYVQIRNMYAKIGDPRDHYGDPNFSAKAWMQNRDQVLGEYGLPTTEEKTPRQEAIERIMATMKPVTVQEAGDIAAFVQSMPKTYEKQVDRFVALIRTHKMQLEEVPADFKDDVESGLSQLKTPA